MTKLEREVRRQIARQGKRSLIITLSPLYGGDAVIAVREKHRRNGFEVTASQLLVILALRYAEAVRSARRARKRRRS